MKLYATITSERASKGQGGNKYLFVDIMAGSSKNSERIAILRVEVEGERWRLRLRRPNGEYINDWSGELKGKKQKGECRCICHSKVWEGIKHPTHEDCNADPS